MFRGRKANFGMLLFIGLVLFQIAMYTFVYYANQDPNFSSVGSVSGTADFDINASTDQDISFSEASHWYDGFDVSVFGFGGLGTTLYVGFQALLFGLAIYSLIRGL